jgi:hypothetical protein
MKLSTLGLMAVISRCALNWDRQTLDRPNDQKEVGRKRQPMAIPTVVSSTLHRTKQPSNPTVETDVRNDSAPLNVSG